MDGPDLKISNCNGQCRNHGTTGSDYTGCFADRRRTLREQNAATLSMLYLCAVPFPKLAIEQSTTLYNG